MSILRYMNVLIYIGMAFTSLLLSVMAVKVGHHGDRDVRGFRLTARWPRE